MKNRKSSYKNGKVKVYIIKDSEGNIIFQGTADEAVKQGVASSQSAFRNRVYGLLSGKIKYGGLTVEKSERAVLRLNSRKKRKLIDRNIPCCILEDTCPSFISKLTFPPCCEYCEYNEVCADRCNNHPDICKCFCKEGSDKYINVYDDIMRDAL